MRLSAAVWGVVVRLASGARPDIAFAVPTDEPVFALTFDDGPDPAITPQVLDVLGGHGARATFFLIGSRAQAHRDLVERIREEGHEVGNHMWREEAASALSDRDFLRSVLMTGEILNEGAPSRLLRPGSGFVSRRKTGLASRCGYRCVLGSVYPLDAQFASARWSALVLRSLVDPGAIVILHEGRTDRKPVLRALDEFLFDARRRGLLAITVGELLARGK